MTFLFVDNVATTLCLSAGKTPMWRRFNFAESNSHATGSLCRMQSSVQETSISIHLFPIIPLSFFVFFSHCDPLKRLSFSICLWMFNLRVVCVYKRATCNLAALSQDILSQHVFFLFRHNIGLNLVHVFRDCTYLPSISIGLDRLKAEETTWRTKCRLNEDFFRARPSFFPLSLLTIWQLNSALSSDETDLPVYVCQFPFFFSLRQSVCVIYLSYYFIP